MLAAPTSTKPTSRVHRRRWSPLLAWLALAGLTLLFSLPFVWMLATIMLPAQATMLPVFLLFRWLGWIGTFRPLWVPAFFGSAFYIFLLRQFFRTIPGELSDAARIDGCGEWSIFWRVMLPLARP